MSEHKPGLYLVRDLEQALVVAADLEAGAIGFDVEGVLEPFYGNEPAEMPAFDDLHENTRFVAAAKLAGRLSVPIGLMTNSTNQPLLGQETGLIDLVATHLGGVDGPVPYVHKGMVLPNGTPMGKKPTGVQGVELASRLGVEPEEAVLIDDQGVKNFGEVYYAGMKAIIVPEPIGFRDAKGRIIEHPGVMKFRRLESAVYSSLASRGPRVLARAAYRAAAGVPILEIGAFEDLRAA